MSDIFERKLILDIDGVVCDHAKAICDWVNKKYNISSKVEDVKEYNYDFGCITFYEAVEECYSKSDFIAGLDIYPRAKEFVDEASKRVKVEFATARKYLHDVTEEWIKQNFGNYNISFVGNKADIESSYLIEDYPPQAIEASKNNVLSFVIQRPWNESWGAKVVGFSNIHYISKMNDAMKHII